MVPISPVSSQSPVSSYWGYLNPRILSCAIWHAVVQIFQKQSESPLGEEHIIAFEELEGDYVFIHKVFDCFKHYLNHVARNYDREQIVYLGSGSELKIFRQFLTDMARSGHPERFFLNQYEIEIHPDANAQTRLLTGLLSLANGDRHLVKKWTQFWNYSLKFQLQEELVRRYKARYQVFPHLNNNAFQKVNIILDTQLQKVIGEVAGEIGAELREQPDDMPEIVPLNSPRSFKAKVCIDLLNGTIEMSEFTFPP